MSAPSSKLQDGAPQTADGGTVERQTWSETDRVWSGLDWTALHSNNKHGPPGSCKLLPALPGFPRCSRGPLIFPGLSATVELPKRYRYSQVALN